MALSSGMASMRDARVAKRQLEEDPVGPGAGAVQPVVEEADEALHRVPHDAVDALAASGSHVRVDDVASVNEVAECGAIAPRLPAHCLQRANVTRGAVVHECDDGGRPGLGCKDQRRRALVDDRKSGEQHAVLLRVFRSAAAAACVAAGRMRGARSMMAGPPGRRLRADTAPAIAKHARTEQTATG